MCSIQIQGPPRPDTTDHEGWAGLAAARSAAGRRPWGRFVRVFGDEDDRRVPGDEELLRALADAEGLVTQLMARQSEILLELRRRRRHEQQQVSPDGHDPDCCTLACCDPDGWIGLEVAQALGVTERQVEHRLSTAERLTRYRHVSVGRSATGCCRSGPPRNSSSTSTPSPRTSARIDSSACSRPPSPGSWTDRAR